MASSPATIIQQISRNSTYTQFTDSKNDTRIESHDKIRPQTHPLNDRKTDSSSQSPQFRASTPGISDRKRDRAAPRGGSQALSLWAPGRNNDPDRIPPRGCVPRNCAACGGIKSSSTADDCMSEERRAASITSIHLAARKSERYVSYAGRIWNLATSSSPNAAVLPRPRDS